MSRLSPRIAAASRLYSRALTRGHDGHSADFFAKGRVWDIAAIAVMAVVLLTALLTFQHYGRTFDEEVQDRYGQYLLDWYTSLGQDRQAVEFMDLFYYGGLFDGLAALCNKISPFGHYETRHLLNALFGVFGLAGAWKLGRLVGGRAVGFMTVALLALWPSWYGMMYIDPKDIPFAGFMTWSLYYLVRMARRYPHVPASLIVKMGIAAGCALGVRVGGMLALCYMVPVLMVAAWRHEGYRLRPTLVSITTRMPVIIVATILVTWLVMLPFWPWAQLDPIHHPFEAFLHFRDDADNDIDTLFLGQQVGPENRPHLYLPVYLAVKSPDILLLLLAAGLGLGLFGLWRQRRGLARAEFLTPTLTALLFSSVFPILYALITSPALYDAERHFLFVMPGFAALAAVAARAMARRLAQPSGAALPVRPWARNAWAGACAVLMTYQAGQMIALHPFEYTFYNDTIGGLPGADGRFETEYWGSSLDAALHDLITHIEASGEATAGGAPMTVWVCGNSDLIEPQLPPYLHLADDLSRADFYLSTTRHGCDKEVDGPIVSKIGRRGVNFAVVKDIRSQLAHQTPSSEEPAGQ